MMSVMHESCVKLMGNHWVSHSSGSAPGPQIYSIHNIIGRHSIVLDTDYDTVFLCQTLDIIIEVAVPTLGGHSTMCKRICPSSRAWRSSTRRHFLCLFLWWSSILMSSASLCRLCRFLAPLARIWLQSHLDMVKKNNKWIINSHLKAWTCRAYPCNASPGSALSYPTGPERWN